MPQQEILVLGDSHASVFLHESFKKHFPHYDIKVVSIGGATASGMDNPNSQTQAYPLFVQALRTSRAKKVIVLLGEIDTGFVIWYRAIKYQASVESMLQRTVTVYSRFLSELARAVPVLCISAPLPTIQDGKEWGEVANARKEVRTSQRERTELTLRFNRQMQQHCQQQGIEYLMLDEECLGEDGCISPRYLNPDPLNHHYAMDAYADLLIKHLSLPQPMAQPQAVRQPPLTPNPSVRE